jgi:acetylornithine deacetylase
MSGGDWPSTVPAECELHGRLSYFPGTEFPDAAKRIEETVRRVSEADPWLAENPPDVEFYGFRSDGHAVPADLPAFKTLGGCHKDLVGNEPDEYAATCTTDLRAFHFYGSGQATCYGPVAENIHGANENVRIDSVIHTARAYALFLARWCGLAE